MSASDLLKFLRELLIHEWVTNKSEYQPSFEGTVHNLEFEAMQYLQPGVYSSVLGDDMLLGLSNVLCLPIVVFTSIESWPYTPIHPRLPLVDINPLLLAFVHVGSGHYSLAFRKRNCFPKSGDNQETGNSKQTTNSYCCCGRGRNSSEKEHVIAQKGLSIPHVVHTYSTKFLSVNSLNHLNQ